VAQPGSSDVGAHVKAWYGTIGSLLNAGSIFVLGVLAARATNTTQVDILEVNMTLQWAWLVFTAFTVAHVFASIFAALYSYRLYLSKTSRTKVVRVYNEISTSKCLYIRGVSGRDRTVQDGAFYRMRWDDPSTWVAHLGAVGALIAMLPWRYGSTLEIAPSTNRWADVLLALGLLIVNWLAGSVWAVALWELAKPRDQSTYFRGIAAWRDELDDSDLQT
jgi:hypothetical protein